jgi:hypothetical protein
VVGDWGERQRIGVEVLRQVGMKVKVGRGGRERDWTVDSGQWRERTSYERGESGRGTCHGCHLPPRESGAGIGRSGIELFGTI